MPKTAGSWGGRTNLGPSHVFHMGVRNLTIFIITAASLASISRELDFGAPDPGPTSHPASLLNASKTVGRKKSSQNLVGVFEKLRTALYAS